MKQAYPIQSTTASRTQLVRSFAQVRKIHPSSDCGNSHFVVPTLFARPARHLVLNVFRFHIPVISHLIDVTDECLSDWEFAVLDALASDHPGGPVSAAPPGAVDLLTIALSVQAWKSSALITARITGPIAS